MRTLIIPCAGNRMVDGQPLYMTQHPDGEILAVKAVHGIHLDFYDRIIYTVLQETDRKFNVAKRIKSEAKFGCMVDVVVLDEKTNGPAETVYRTILKTDIKGEFAVRDSHVYIEVAGDCSGNYIAGLDLTTYPHVVEDLRSRSFIILNEQKQILDIVEKHFCSDVISLGLYGFKSTEDFISAFEHLSDPDYPIEKLYLSHIISYLIGYKQNVFHAVDVTRFEDWSTLSAWKKVQKSYATCFINVDAICDKDGCVTKTCMERLLFLSNIGNQFIGFSSNNNVEQITATLMSAGIHIITIIGSCSYSKVKTLLMNTNDLDEWIIEVQ